MRTMIGIPAALLAALVLSSCASSDRMVRMSGGALGSYEAPKAERVANFEAKAGAGRRTGDQLNGLDQSLVNIWPLFFRNADYYSVLWPMIDRDPYGFAVRPFYNQEGNEHAILFPLSAWNPANGDGWALNAWWMPKQYGFFPLFLHSGDDRLCYYTLAWSRAGRCGFFPLMLHSSDDRLSYYLLAWTSAGEWGVLPLGASCKDWGYVLNTWWRTDAGGKLTKLTSYPLFSWRPSGFNHALLLYGERRDSGEWRSWGVFPLGFSGPRWGYVLNTWWRGNGEDGLDELTSFPLGSWQRCGINYALLLYGDRDADGKWKMWGVAPGLCHFEDRFGMVTLAWWERDGRDELEKGGFFPLLRLSRDLNYAGPAWWLKGSDRKLESWGFFPLFRFRSWGDQYFFPLYTVSDDGSFFLSPFAGWENTPEKSMFSVLGPLWYQVRRAPVAPEYQWSGVKEENFQLAGAMAYWGSLDSYRMPVAGLEPFRNSQSNWKIRKAWVHRKLAQVGIDARPQTYQEFKQLGETIKAKREIERTDEWGFFPLLSRTASERETRTAMLLGLLGYRRWSPDQSYCSFLTPLFFSAETRRNVRGGELEEKSFLALPLLSGGKSVLRYPDGKAKIYRELQSFGGKFGADEHYNAFLRIRAGQLLRNLGIENAELPAYVCDRESMDEYLGSLRGELAGEVEKSSSCTVFPLFTWKETPQGDSAVLWALLSGWSRDGWLAFPLLSGYGRDPRSETTSILFPFYFHKQYTADDASPIVERKAIFETKLEKCFEADDFRFGLFYFQQQAKFRTPVTEGQAEAINRILTLVGRWEVAEADLSEAGVQAAELFAALHEAKPEFTDRQAVEAYVKTSENPFRLEIDQLCARWKRCEVLQKTIAECRDNIAKLTPLVLDGKIPAPDRLASAQALAAKLKSEAVRTEDFSASLSLPWCSRRAGDEFEWRIFGILAEGERRGTEQSSVSVLKLLYRHRQEGTRSDTLMFPFVSMRRDGDDYRFNFLHRVFSTYREKGKAGGYFLYIPF